MNNLMKVILNSSIIAIFGLSLSGFISYFILNNPSLFWTLVVLLWMIVGIANGFIIKSLKESLLSGLIIGIFSFFMLFVIFIILGLFSDYLVDVFSSVDIFTRQPAVLFAFLYSLLFTVIVVFLAISFSILTFYGRKHLKSSSSKNTDEIEDKFYKKYEPDSNENTSDENN
ncbi:MAG: hypothetical protein ACFFDW_05720 [Candidatus Thorarchaeota archaeon]